MLIVLQRLVSPVNTEPGISIANPTARASLVRHFHQRANIMQQDMVHLCASRSRKWRLHSTLDTHARFAGKLR